MRRAGAGLNRWWALLLGMTASVLVATVALAVLMTASGLASTMGLGASLPEYVLAGVALHAVALGLPLAICAAWWRWRVRGLAPIMGGVIGAAPLGIAEPLTIGVGGWSDLWLLMALVGATGSAGVLAGLAYAVVWRRTRSATG